MPGIMQLIGGLCAAGVAAGAVVWLAAPAPVAATAQGCTLTETDLGRFIDIPGGGYVIGADPEYPEEAPRACLCLSLSPARP